MHTEGNNLIHLLDEGTYSDEELSAFISKAQTKKQKQQAQNRQTSKPLNQPSPIHAVDKAKRRLSLAGSSNPAEQRAFIESLTKPAMKTLGLGNASTDK